MQNQLVVIVVSKDIDKLLTCCIIGVNFQSMMTDICIMDFGSYNSCCSHC